MTEEVVGLGALAATEMLQELALSNEDDARSGPEFTFIGVFLSGLCSASKGSSGTDVVQLCLGSLRSVHGQLGASDSALADSLAESAFREYFHALPSWPGNAGVMQAGVALCSVLAARLKTLHGVELDTMKQARLRTLIARQIEILEVAFTEMRGVNLGPLPINDDKASHSMQGSVPNIAALDAAKSKLLADYEDGEITGREYMDGLEGLMRQEIALRIASIQIEPKLDTLYKSHRIRRIFLLVATTSALLGFFVSPWIYPKLFGYRNAEECAIATKSKYAIGACYDLYPSVKQ